VIAEARLRDGTPALIWPLDPGDREAVREGFEQLSVDSRYHRFLATVPHLSDAQLDHLVDEVDGVDHVALVLMAKAGDEVVPTGIARCVRYPHEPEAADIAVTVKDDWQGRGVATALLDVLMRRRPEGVTHLLTEVAADNPASLAMLRHLGPVRTFDTGMGILDVEVDLVPTGHSLVHDEPHERLHEVLADPGRARLRARDLVCPWLRPSSEETADGPPAELPGAQSETPAGT